jgi:hypothetical protein
MFYVCFMCLPFCRHKALVKLELRSLPLTTPRLSLPLLRTLELSNVSVCCVLYYVEMLLMTLKTRGIQCKYLLLPSSSELPSLTSCDVSRSGVTKTDLFAFLQGLSSTKLTVLRAKGCKNLRHSFIPESGAPEVLPALHSLREASFGNSNVDAHFVTEFLGYTPNLEVLGLEFAPNLGDATFSHAKLKVITQP